MRQDGKEAQRRMLTLIFVGLQVGRGFNLDSSFIFGITYSL